MAVKEPELNLDGDNVVLHTNEVVPDENPVTLEQGKPSGSARIIAPEPRKPVERKVVDYSDFENPKLVRLAAISGRTLAHLNPLHGGDIAWGYLNLLNVDTNEQITCLPDAKIPDGTWVPVNLLPQEYLDTLK